MNASEIDFAWHVFVDLVIARTTTRARVPDDSEAEGLAKRALEIATLFSSALEGAARASGNRPANFEICT